MAVNCNLAPFINHDFMVTGAWGEPRSGHIHAGIDLATVGSGGVAQPVYSMSQGVVIFVDPDGHTGSGYGPYVIVRNSTNNDLWLYGDLGQNPVVSVGDVIQQGAQIGVEGNPASTSSTGLHVHLEKENQADGVFKYGYANSIDPTAGTGITNATDGTIYIYNGTPVPPTPPTPVFDKKPKKKYPWAVYLRKFRNRRGNL